MEKNVTYVHKITLKFLDEYYVTVLSTVRYKAVTCTRNNLDGMNILQINERAKINVA